LCLNGGTCVFGPGSNDYNCSCAAGYTGLNCSELFTCSPSCSVHGTCNNNTGTCDCDYGYVDETCSTPYGCAIPVAVSDPTASSSDWATTTTWTKGGVPSLQDDVTISLSSATSELNIFTISSAYGLTVAEGILAINGDLTIDDTSCTQCSVDACVYGTCVYPDNYCDCDYGAIGSTCNITLSCNRPVNLTSAIGGNYYNWAGDSWSTPNGVGFYDSVTIYENVIINVTEYGGAGQLKMVSGWLVIDDDVTFDIESSYCTDACSLEPCQHGAVCNSISLTNYTCSCMIGWGGYNCTELACSPSCINGACQDDGDDTTSCNCVAGWIGDACDIDDPCYPSNPCQHGAECLPSLDGTLNCNCSLYWTNSSSYCTTMTCVPSCVHGTCTDKGDDTNYCDCDAGWSGSSCSSAIPPDAPTDVLWSVINETSIIVTWSLASSNGHTILAYRIGYKLVSDSSYEFIDITDYSSQSYVIITDLLQMSPAETNNYYTINVFQVGDYAVRGTMASITAYIGYFDIYDTTFGSLNAGGSGSITIDAIPTPNNKLQAIASGTQSDDTPIPLIDTVVWWDGVTSSIIVTFSISSNVVDGQTWIYVSFAGDSSQYYPPFDRSISLVTYGKHVLQVSTDLWSRMLVGSKVFGTFNVTGNDISLDLIVTWTTSTPGVTLSPSSFLFGDKWGDSFPASINVSSSNSVGEVIILISLGGAAASTFAPLAADVSTYRISLVSIIEVSQIAAASHVSTLITDTVEAPWVGAIQLTRYAPPPTQVTITLQETEPYFGGIRFYNADKSAFAIGQLQSGWINTDSSSYIYPYTSPSGPLGYHVLSLTLSDTDAAYYSLDPDDGQVSILVIGAVAASLSSPIALIGMATTLTYTLSAVATQDVTLSVSPDTSITLSNTSVIIKAGSLSESITLTPDALASLGDATITTDNTDYFINVTNAASVTVSVRNAIMVSPPLYIIAGLSRIVTYTVDVAPSTSLLVSPVCVTCADSGNSLLPATGGFGTSQYVVELQLTASETNAKNASELMQWGGVGALGGGDYSAGYYEATPYSSYVQFYPRQPITLPIIYGLAGGDVISLTFSVDVPPHTWFLLTINVSETLTITPNILNFTSDVTSFTVSLGAAVGYPDHIAVMSFNVSGNDAAGFYTTITQRTINVAPQGEITIATMTSALLSGASNGLARNLSLNLAVASSLTLTPTSLPSGVVMIPNPIVLTVGQEWKLFDITSSDASLNEVYLLNFTVSGSSSIYYQTPSPWIIWFGTPGSVDFSISDVQAGSSTSFVVTLDRLPVVTPLNVSWSTGTSDYTVTPSVTTFDESSALLATTLTLSPQVTAAAGSRTLTAVYSGSYSNGYAAASATFNILSAGSWTVPSDFVVIYGIAARYTITRSSTLLGSNGNVTLTLTVSNVGISITPSVLTWTSTSSLSQSVTILVPAGVTGATISYSVGGNRANVHITPTTSSVSISSAPVYSAAATVRTSTSITLGWTAPLVYVTPLSYKIVLNGSVVTFPSSTTSWLFQGLLADTSYSYTLTALSSIGSASVTGVVSTYPSSPSISSFTGFGASDSTTPSWIVGNMMVIQFDRDTNQPTITSATLDTFMTFTPLLSGTVLVPTWYSATVLVLTCTSVGSVSPSLGTQTVTIRSVGNIITSDGRSLASTSTSPVLGGHWGRSIAYFRVTQSVTLLNEGSSGSLIPLRIDVPSTLKSRQLTLNIQVGSNIGALTSTDLSVASATSITTSGTAYALNRIVSRATYTPTTGYSGTVALTFSLIDTTSSVPVDTAVIYFTMVAVNSPPTISTPSYVTLPVNTFASVSGISIYDSDWDVAKITSSTRALPLKLTIMATPGALLNFTSLPSDVISSSLMGTPVRRWELLGTASALNTSLSYLTARYPLRAAHMTTRLWIAVNDLGNGASSPGFAGDLAATRVLDIRLQCTSVEPSAPTLANARMSSSWNSVIMTFNAPVAYSSVSVSCSSILSPDTTRFLGVNPTCTWSSGTSTELTRYTSWITVTLGYGNTVTPYSTQFITPGVQVCSNFATSASSTGGSVILQPPLVPTESPLWVHIHTPTTIPTCHTSSIALTAIGGTGFGGRPANFTWTRSSDASWSYNNTNVRTSTLSIIPNQQSLITELFTVTMTVVMSLSKRLTATSSQSITFTDKSIPLLWPSTHNNDHGGHVSPGTTIWYRARLESSSCASLTSSAYSLPSCQWSSSGSALVVDPTTSASMNVKVHALNPSPTQLISATLTLNCTYGSSVNQWSTLVYPVTFDSRLSSLPVAVIIGGSNQTAWTRASFKLDGSSSYISDAHASIALYAWSCGVGASIADGGDICRTLTGDVLVIPDASVAIIDTTSLSPDCYFFTLTISASDARTATSTVTVTLLPSPSPLVYPPSVKITSNIITPVSNSPLVLTATIQPTPINLYALTYVWRILGGSIPTSPTLTSSVLSLNPSQSNGFFTPGASYTFEVSVTDSTLATTATVAAAIATWTVTIPSLPRAPLVVVTPSVTTALNSATILAVGVDNETVSWPTVIRFYVDNVLVDANTDSPFSYVASLPQGLASNGYLVGITVRVYDGNTGAYTEGTGSVYVGPSSITNSTALLSAFSSTLTSVAASSEQQLSVVSSVITAADSLTTTSAPDLLSIITTATTTLTSISLSSTASIPTSTLLSSLVTLTSSNAISVLDTSSRAQLLALLMRLLSIDWTDRAAVSSLITAVSNLIQVSISTYTGASRRLLVIGSNELEDVDQLYGVFYSIAANLTSQLAGDGDLRSYEQADTTIYVTRTPLPWIVTNSSLTSTLSFNYVSSSLTVAMSATFTGFPASDSARASATSTLQSTNIGVLVVSPNPYRPFGTVIPQSKIIGPAVTLFSSAYLANVGTSLVAPSLPYTITIPYNQTSCSRSMACRPMCASWNSSAGEWSNSGISSPLLDETLYRVTCGVSIAASTMGPITAYKYIVATPSITSAVVTITTLSVLFTWDSATNMAGRTLSVAWPCTTVFSTSTISSWAGIPSCKWLSSTQLQLTGFGPVVILGSTISIATGAIQSQDGFSFTNAAQSITTTLASGQTLPSIVARIDGADQLSQCDTANFTGISSTGNGGHQFVGYSWSVTGASPTSGSLTSSWLYFSLTSANAIAPIVLTLTITNWLGQTSTITKTVPRAATAIPSISLLEGNYLVSQRSLSVTSTAVGVLSSCASNNTGASLSYKWTQVSNGAPALSLSASTASSSVLTLPSYTLIPNTTYMLTATVTQVDASLANSVILTLQVIPSTPPTLLYAQLVRSATRLRMYFDLDTDGAGMLIPLNKSCSKVLDQSTLAILSGTTSASCTWTNATTLTVSMGADYTAVDGASIGIQANAVRSQDGYSAYSAPQSVMLMAPTDTTPISANVIGASTLSSCSGLTLSGANSTGKGGKPSSFRYQWMLISPTDQPLLNASVIAQSSSKEIILTATLLPANTTYVFSLQVTNWRNTSASTLWTVVKEGVPVLQLSLVNGNYRYTTPADDELTQVNPDLTSACGLVSSRIGYSWQQIDGPELPLSLLRGSSAKIFTIPKHLMVAGESYSFISTVTIARVVEGVSSNLTNSITLTLVISASPLAAVISGGDRLVSLASDSDRVRVSAASSYDPDLATSVNTEGLTYSWSCITAESGLDCFNVSDTSIDVASSVISLTPSHVAEANGEDLVFTVAVTKTADGRQSTATVTMATSITFVPGVSISTSASQTKFNPEIVLRLVGTASPLTSDLSWSWTCESQNLDMTDTTNFASSTTSSSLAIAANALDGGATYVFVLTATDSSDRSGVARISITTNAPPTIGTCTSSMNAGQVNTTFTLSCSEWSDDLEDLPLQYGFFLDSAAGLLEVGYFSTDEAIAAYLPPGSSDDNYMLSITVIIRDVWGASSSSSFMIAVFPPDDLGVTSSTSPFIDQLSVSEEAGDVNRFAQSLLAVTALLDASRDSQTTTLTSDQLSERASVRYIALGYLENQADDDDSGISTSRIQQQVQLAFLLCQNTDELNSDARVHAIQFVASRASTAYNNSDIEFTSSMGDSMLRTVDQVSFSITATLANAIANGTIATADVWNITALATENAAVARSFLSSLSLISRGEVKSHVAGETAVVHNTNRVYVASSRRSNTSLSNADIGFANTTEPGFKLPGNLSSSLYDYTTVDISFFTMQQHVFSFADIGVTSGGQSRLVGLTLYGTRDSSNDENGQSSVIEVDGLPDDSRILVYVPHDNTTYTQVCRFWNETSRNYSTDGCYLYSSNATGAICSCSHLTVFNVNLIPTITDPTEALLNFNWDNLSAHPAGIITVGCIWFVYFCLWWVALRHDRKLNEYALAEFHAAHQRRGTQYYTGFIPDGDEELHASSLARFRYMFGKNLAVKHLWYSTFMRTADAGFSSRERLTQSITMLIVSLAMNAVFYGVDRDIGQDLVIMAYCCLVNVPLSIYLRRMFGIDPTHNNAWKFLQTHVRRAELTAAGIKWTAGKEDTAWAELEEREMNAVESVWGGMPGGGIKRAASIHPAAAASRQKPKGCCARSVRLCSKIFCGCKCFIWQTGQNRRLRLLGYHHRYIALPPFESIMTIYRQRSWKDKLPPPRKLYAYVVAWLMMVVASFVVLLFALQFDLHQPDYVYEKFGGSFSATWPVSGRWLFSTLLASLISVLAQQPLSIFLQTFMMACICYRVMYKKANRQRSADEERAIELPSGMMVTGEPTQRRIVEENHEVKRLAERNFIDQGFNKIVVPDYSTDGSNTATSPSNTTTTGAASPIVVAGTSTFSSTVIGGTTAVANITVLPGANPMSSPISVDAASPTVLTVDADYATATALLNASLMTPTATTTPGATSLPLSSPLSSPSPAVRFRNAPDAADTIHLTVDAVTPMSSPLGSPEPGAGSPSTTHGDPKLLSRQNKDSSHDDDLREGKGMAIIIQRPNDGKESKDEVETLLLEDTAESLVDQDNEHAASSFLSGGGRRNRSIELSALPSPAAASSPAALPSPNSGNEGVASSDNGDGAVRRRHKSSSSLSAPGGGHARTPSSQRH
jgi:hypothetical protein